jgi:hypothetical protein
VTIQRLKAKTSPAVSAPPKRIPSARASKNIPKAATHSLRTPVQGSAAQ